jgi:two-component system, NtrC family, nitrogen regulation sensor histidine kinase NtrY
MTLGTRIVAALILAALIPMAVVLAVPLVRAEKRAREQTEQRLEQARRQATILLDEQRADLGQAADRAAEDLASDREALAAVVRGPETLASPVAQALAERFVLAHVTIVSDNGTTLAAYGAGEPGPETAVLVERRRVQAGPETLTLVVTRWLAAAFAGRVAAITGDDARVGAPGATGCSEPNAEVPIVEGAALCVGVAAADAREVRRDLLRSFAGVAPVAFVAALLVGFVLASRIARPIRALALRAEGISAEQSRPISLLPEKDETRRLTVAFDQMLDALSASERQRLAAERAAAWEEIARRLAHEIKNPLSPIQLAVENLRRTRERAPEAFDRAFAEETATILEEVASLRALVDEFAQFARLPRPRVAPCDPRAIAAQALTLFSARIEAMGVRVTVDDAAAPRTIQADAEQLGRVLKNVVANALDAMESSSERSLAIEVRAAGDDVAFTVRDTGAGFDGEALRRVFEPYFTTRGDRGGTGLGMAIAHRIALEHGGSIRADGAPGRGATVTLTIPLAGPRPVSA